MNILFFYLIFCLNIPFFEEKNVHSCAVCKQDSDLWQVLFNVKYGNWRETFKPQFSEKIKKLDNTQVKIKGFLIPLEEKAKKHHSFLLSAYPFDACFYCGKAGPETVIEVSCKTAVKYTTSLIQISGTLKLNYDDPEHLFYLISDGKEVK